MRNGRCPITVAIIRNRGRVATAMSVSVFFPLRIPVSVFSFCRFWTHIATLNARSNTVCCFLCWFLQLSFSLRSRRDRKFIHFNLVCRLLLEKKNELGSHGWQLHPY